MKVLLLGDTGSLGSEFRQLFSNKKVHFYCINRKKKKFKFNFSKLKNLIFKQKPHLIINCIGLTGLIYCQNKKKEAYEVNSKIPQRIIKIIKGTQIRLIHFSTEAVFKGNKLNKIYSEKDKPKPGTIYGKSKYDADKKILKAPNTLVIRLPLLFGPTHKKQIVSKLLKLIKDKKKIFVADDVYSTPLYTPEVCKFVFDNFIKNQKTIKTKLIHFTGSRLISMYKLILELSKSIPGANHKNIIRVKDAYFNTGIKIKPKNLGLTSRNRKYIKTINYKVGKYLI